MNRRLEEQDRFTVLGMSGFKQITNKVIGEVYWRRGNKKKDLLTWKSDNEG